MKPFQTIHLWGKGVIYLGNIMLSRIQTTAIHPDKLEELVDGWGDKRKVCYVTFE